MSVSHWLSCFQLMFSPQSMLLSGSLPMVTFEVSDCSLSFWNVPLSWKSLEKSYSQFTPYMVFLCIPYSVSVSSETFTDVPASMMLWLRMVTSPAE